MLKDMENLIDITSPIAITAYVVLGILLILSLFYVMRKKVDESEEPISEIAATEISDAPSFLENFQVDTKNARIEEAKILANYGRFDKAVDILNEQIRDYPNEQAAYFELFLIYFHEENEIACLDLFEILPFAKTTATYQNFLSNAKMEFPNSEQIWALGDEPIKNIQPVKEVADKTVAQDKPKVQTQVKTKSKVSHVPRKTSASVNHPKPVKKQPSLINNKRQGRSRKVITVKPETIIQNMDQLELLVFKSFSSHAVVDKKFKEYLDKHEKTWQTLAALKPKFRPLMTLSSDKPETSEMSQDPLTLIYNQAKQLMVNEQFEHAEKLLEQKLLENTDYEKLYPLLMQNYIQGASVEAYYKFRDAIFDHPQQPSLETIYLLADTESKIIEKHEMVA